MKHRRLFICIVILLIVGVRLQGSVILTLIGTVQGSASTDFSGISAKIEATDSTVITGGDSFGDFFINFFSSGVSGTQNVNAFALGVGHQLRVNWNASNNIVLIQVGQANPFVLQAGSPLTIASGSMSDWVGSGATVGQLHALIGSTDTSTVVAFSSTGSPPQNVGTFTIVPEAENTAMLIGGMT